MRRSRTTVAALASAAVILALALALPVLAQVVAPSSLRPAIDARYPGVSWVDTSTLAEWMRAPEDRRLLILDVREPNEFTLSHLRGARRVAPDARDMSALAIPRDTTIVVYCSVGYRSAEIAVRLREARYRRVYNLQGGIFQWANEGRALFRGERATEQVHPYDNDWGRMLIERYRAPL
jgi:rhodanese-related sulfurtransferase